MVLVQIQKFTHLLFVTYKKWLYQNENTKGVLERHIWNNWAYRITKSYHQPRKKQTTQDYCYIIRSNNHIIILKRCPILQTYIHKIITHCWTHQMFPRCWKYAFTIFIYKKKSNTEPPNFHPITLQPLLAKIYSSFIHNL